MLEEMKNTPELTAMIQTPEHQQFFVQWALTYLNKQSTSIGQPTPLQLLPQSSVATEVDDDQLTEYALSGDEAEAEEVNAKERGDQPKLSWKISKKDKKEKIAIKKKNLKNQLKKATSFSGKTAKLVGCL